MVVSFNLCSLNTRTKVSFTLTRDLELLYADKCALPCIKGSFSFDTLSVKDRGNITTKAWDHFDSISSVSWPGETEGSGRDLLLRGHRFQ